MVQILQCYQGYSSLGHVFVASDAFYMVILQIVSQGGVGVQDGLQEALPLIICQ
jgi:hypothetical protein